jgi:serine/threonine protein phosphatase PrpC
VSPFRAKVEEWLSRPVPERAINECLGISLALATEVGLQRVENQDRVAGLKLVSGKTNRAALFAAVVADGMGGMRDGGKCATIALATFLSELVSAPPGRLEELALNALICANEAVFAFAHGKGGTTLSAVLVEATGRAVVVHVGDSRVYSYGQSKKVQRWTTDDSLAEVVGGDGRELLQFAGMGSGIKPHVVELPNAADMVAITSDGIHYIEVKTFEQILLNASTPRSAAERLAALSKWCGGHDNGSLAVFDLKTAARGLGASLEPSVQLWDPFGTMTTIWIKPNGDRVEDAYPKQAPKTFGETPPIKNTPPAVEPSVTAPSGSSKSKQTEKQKRGKKGKQSKADVQLEIEIDHSPSSKKAE